MDIGRVVIPLVAGKDLHIIACGRAPVKPPRADKKRDRSRRCVGVRWASRQDLGFPLRGYEVTRRLADADAEAPATVLGTFVLPATNSWDDFAADVTGRRPAVGPWFDEIVPESHGYLFPLIRLVDPRTPAQDLRALVLEVAEFFGDTHQENAELAWTLWGYGEPPPLDSLLDDPATAPSLIRFYRARATEFLLALALRFEYAVLLGLAVDDWAPAADVLYEVRARWEPLRIGTAMSDRVRTNSRCSPPPPKWLTTTRVPGTLPHPAFQAWSAWTPPAALAPVDAEGAPLASSALIPRYPSAFTALTWAPPPAETTLIGHGPVLYRAGRFEHGAGTAGLGTAPALPTGGVFSALGDGEDLLRPPHEPHYVDLSPGPWREFEGFYHYQVRGVDLLGVESVGVVRTALRHHDDIAPATPRARVDAELVMELSAGATAITVPLSIDWDAAEDFAGPDVREFRVAASWIPTVNLPVHIETVTDIDVLHVDVTLSSLTGAANAYAAGRLSTPGSEFPIVSHGSGATATMRVRKLGTRKPTGNSDALVISAGVPTPVRRVARMPRQPVVPATVTAVQLGVSAPVEATLTAATAMSLPVDATVRAYLHLLRTTVHATRIDTSRWRFEPPPDGTPARDTWERWLALPNPDAALVGSPVLFFPPHSLSVQVAVPPGFTAGILDLFVTSADDATYVSSLSLPVADASLAALVGNESARAEAFVSVRSAQPPGVATVPAYDPNHRLWAQSAANFAESATFALSWSPAAGGVRYEVWRALEGALGAGASTSDTDLRALAASTDAAYEVRSTQVFGATFVDSLPGRAPTRALYRVRAVSAAGVPGGFCPVIGPVYVPDVRRPPAPNLISTNAARPSVADRAIALEWTQAGALDGVRFDIYFRESGRPDAVPAPAGTVPSGSAPGPGGRFRLLHLERPPGKSFTYFVVAVREALDPIDPAAALKRDIESEHSEEMTGSAIASGPLVAPVALTATPGASGVALAWDNRDWYEAIEIRRKATGQYRYEVLETIGGDAEAYEDTGVSSGIWHYQLRALGVRREARSAIDAEVIVP